MAPFTVSTSTFRIRQLLVITTAGYLLYCSNTEY